MVENNERIITLSIPLASPDLVLEKSQELINELNSVQGRVAPRMEGKSGTGTKGDPVTLGAIALALISAGITKQIANVLIEFIKRNPKLIIKVGTVELTADYASTKRLEALNSIVQQLGVARSK
jgi:hypothetical protein